MQPDLQSLKTKLEACSEPELHALIHATYRVVGCPMFVSWVDASCRWELGRRSGRRNLGDLRCGVAFEDPALIDTLLRLRTLVEKSGIALFAVLDEIERLMKPRGMVRASASAA